MKHIKLFMIVCVLSIFATLAVLNIYNQYKNADLLLDNNIETLTEQESNNSGSGKFYYEHLEGRPKECTLYKHYKYDGSFSISESKATMSGDIEVVKVLGIKETCPRNGSGCTAYSCTLTD